MFQISRGLLRRLLMGRSVELFNKKWNTDFPEPETLGRQQVKKSAFGFLGGYNKALEFGFSPLLISELDGYNRNLRGFAYEGAGMGLAMIDYTALGKRSRLQEFLEGPAAQYPELIHVGAGFSIALLHKNIHKTLSQMPPFYRWWAIDGFAFCRGIFEWKKCVIHQVTYGLDGYFLRAFDRGLGRWFWFMHDADVMRIVDQLQNFPDSRHADLWSGIGLACTYAGGVNQKQIEFLKESAKSHVSYLALGSALAAKCRLTADHIVEHNDLACSILCNMSTEEVGQLTLHIAKEIKIDPDESVLVEQPIFETWREAIRSQLTR